MRRYNTASVESYLFFFGEKTLDLLSFTLTIGVLLILKLKKSEYIHFAHIEKLTQNSILALILVRVDKIYLDAFKLDEKFVNLLFN